MKKKLKSFLLIIIAFLSSWFGYLNITDPALIVSQTDIDKDIIISKIENNNSEIIYLKAGNDKFGLNHILKKHTRDFFPESKQKGNLFPSGTTGKQIIKGIESVYRNGNNDPNAYGNKTVLRYETKLNGKKGNYRLVINNQNEIITFFRLKNKA